HEVVRAHHGALETLSRELRLPPEVLRRLHAMHRGVALNSLFHTMQCFYVDRMAVVGLGFVLTAGVLAFFDLSALAFALAGVCVVLVVAGLSLLARARAAEIPPKLVRASHAVAAIVGVPLVVMGHSHHACVVPTADASAHYVNTGTWIPPHGEHAIGFTHLRVRRTAGGATPDAELRRWKPGSGPVKLG
ncbi:MAG TPA: hypothetical protein VMV18_08945, partial [bacterium]|nr:hypothetical protein [bacterium]